MRYFLSYSLYILDKIFQELGNFHHHKKIRKEETGKMFNVKNVKNVKEKQFIITTYLRKESH